MILLTFGFSLTITLREGTVIGMLFSAPLIGFFMRRIQPVFKKLDLTNETVGEFITNKDSKKVV